jgi:hypothetical protein
VIKLRHIRGPRLVDLELELQNNPEALNVVSITKTGSDWYVHFTIESAAGTRIANKRKVEVNNGTKTLEKS